MKWSEVAESQISDPLVGTKLRPPPLVSAYRERSRLSAKLDAALEDQTRLTLISAPPGYGKTVAVAGWLAARDVPYAWLSLDRADNDLSRLARYLAAALRSVRPAAEAATLGLLGPGTSAPPELMGAILVEAMAASDEPFVLVLDDVHVLTAEPIGRLVRFLIDHGPPFAHPVLVTREDPPLPLARLRAHGRLVELRADDLRYSADEASAYLGAADLDLVPDLAARLIERTEGWIAGLQMAAISLRDRPDAAAIVEAFSGSQRFVLDYLADEVLARLDDDLRWFLIGTSIADRFDVGLARALSGRENADALLARAERANLFLVPLGSERGWYRYHHLFADYLRSRLSEDERRALHERAADYLDAHGLGREAIGHALAAGSLDRAIGLIEREARPTFEAGEITTLLGWLDALPEERVATSAELVSLRGWALFLTGQIAAAKACADSHPITPRAPGSPEGRLYALRALLAPFFPGEADAEDLARSGLELLGEDDPIHAMTLLALGVAWLSRSEWMAAIETLRPALESARRTGRWMTAAASATMLGLGLVSIGARSEAEALAREFTEGAPVTGSAAGAATWFLVHWLLGVARYEAGDLVEARVELERGYLAASRFGLARQSLGALVQYLALARQATGSPDTALEPVRAVARDARVAGTTRVAAQTAETEARIRLLQGDLAAAATWAAQPMTDAVDGTSDIWRRPRDLTIARVRLAQSRPAEARNLLAAARRAAEVDDSVAELITIGILEAAVAEATGRHAAARRSLEEAIRLAAPGGYVQRFVDDGRSVARLLPLVRRESPAFVDRVIAAVADAGRSDRPAPARQERAVWPDASGQLLEPLTARELDVLRLMAQGCTNANISDRLAISPGTAKWHVGNIRAKLGVTNRTAALVRAQELGLV
jgi:LuxR family maltose regulon positive regulatory protein